MKTELFRFEIPNYIREIKVSEKQRARYWEYRLSDGQFHGCGKIFPKKYIKPEFQYKLGRDGDGKSPIYPNHLYNCYFAKIGSGTDTKLITNKEVLIEILKEGYKVILCDELVHRIIINPTQIGKPKIEIIKGNRIYAGINEHTKTKMIDAIKEQVKLCLWNAIRNPSIAMADLPLKNRPLIIDYELHDTVEDKNSTNWDLDNRMYLYRKCINDILVSENVIEEDNILCITGGSELFVLLLPELGEVPKIVVIISSDDRPEIKSLLFQGKTKELNITFKTK